MFWNILANENTKNLKRSMLWIELAILAGLMLILFALLYTSMEFNFDGGATPAEVRTQMQSSLVWPGSLIEVLGFAGGNALGGMLLIILVAAVTAQEYTWRTLHLWLSRGTPRPALLAAKFTALILPAFLIVLTALISVGMLTGIFSVLLTGSLNADQVNFLQLGFSVVRTTYTLLPYAALTFLLAIASRSVVVAVGGGLAFSLLFEGITIQMLALVGGKFAQAGNYLPAGLANSILSLNSSIAKGAEAVASGLPEGALSPVPAAIGIALWSGLLVLLALWIFQRQDLTD